MKIKEVVGVAFIENNKLLIVQSRKSSKTNSYTFIGGGVEVGETLLKRLKEKLVKKYTVALPSMRMS